uniref:C2H2-type domain-containing protein n=1 Tax=Chromera velia CCMP2878 TaxID=1169474 RepID=A0A0G4I428_9ALVE|eukprot:Cvel_10812.t1-p1 / transcript=Cvel_10812.t1 / gene=Cvel_10812 / organism=Chromera_velia_CCMP2878 / gene_product=hypothetical protein / transcript_product=hypothetical protein / location=Cvel_scaffold661:42031-42489(-) / protein_length=153 / sequence_SO=supercontig / SO=protein_coding / is_pseudo=false
MFKCEWCPKSFPTQSNLNRHQRENCGALRAAQQHSQQTGGVVEPAFAPRAEWDRVYLSERTKDVTVEEYIENLQADVIKKLKWCSFVSYTQSSSFVGDLNKLYSAIQSANLKGPLFSTKLEGNRHGMRDFALMKGEINDDFIGKRMKRLDCGI